MHSESYAARRLDWYAYVVTAELSAAVAKNCVCGTFGR